jgi:hypothetical protein
MLKINDENYDALDRYILNDDPIVCCLCGARTNFHEINNVTQLHECLNSNCRYEFITEE